MIALTHDPKIDDPALQHALKNNFFYIGALGSKKTHANRCTRLKEAGFNDAQIIKIFGPIGIKLGGRSAPEIALSIISQLVSEVYREIQVVLSNPICNLGDTTGGNSGADTLCNIRPLVQPPFFFPLSSSKSSRVFRST